MSGFPSRSTSFSNDWQQRARAAAVRQNRQSPAPGRGRWAGTRGTHRDLGDPQAVAVQIVHSSLRAPSQIAPCAAGAVGQQKWRAGILAQPRRAAHSPTADPSTASSAMCLKCTVGCCNSVISLTQRPSEAFTRETRTHGRAIRSGAPRALSEYHGAIGARTRVERDEVRDQNRRDQDGQGHDERARASLSDVSSRMRRLVHDDRHCHRAISSAHSLCDGLVATSHFSARGKSKT